MSFDFRHWLALACLFPALAFFAMSRDMPLFKDPARLLAIRLNEQGTDYRLKREQFNQAVKEELTPRLEREERAVCFLALAFLLLQLPRRWRSVSVSRVRVLAYGFGALIVYPVLAIDQVVRDHDRGLYPVWTDSMGPISSLTIVLDMLLLVVLVPFLYRACRGAQGAGRVFRGVAAFLGVSGLLLAVLGMWSADYVVLATQGLVTLFFMWFLLGTQTRR